MSLATWNQEPRIAIGSLSFAGHQSNLSSCGSNGRIHINFVLTLFPPLFLGNFSSIRLSLNIPHLLVDTRGCKGSFMALLVKAKTRNTAVSSTVDGGDDKASRLSAHAPQNTAPKHPLQSGESEHLSKSRYAPLFRRFGVWGR